MPTLANRLVRRFSVGQTRSYSLHNESLQKVSRESPKLQRLFYGLLFVLLAGSLALFVANVIANNLRAWEWYTRTYLIFLLAYTWMIFILLSIGDMKIRKYPKYANETISVIMPCYNEDPTLLRRSIQSIIQADGNKEIIVVDDGSRNGIQLLLEELSHEYGIIIHFFRANKGKRYALHHAVKNLISQSDFVVTVDSDTVLDHQALVRIVEPLKDPKIGASTGDVQLLNEHQNWLTKMVASYYWVGLNVYKQAQSTVGNVVCCSGCIAAYRTKVIERIIDRFVDQKFFGEECTHSEDRHLTNLVLQRNYKVVYVPEAISYTETPATLRGFLKQQQRWKRGFVRESLFTMSYAWRNRPLLFFQLLLWDLTVPFLSLGMVLWLFLIVFLNPMFFLTVVVPSWAIFMLIRYMPIVFFGKNKVYGLFVYTLVYELFLYWQNIYALFTFRNKSWITR